MIVEAASKPRVYCGHDMSEGELHPLGWGLASVFTARCPDSPDPNEDSCAVIPFDDRSGLLVVADGCGGLPAGAKASEIAVNALRASVRAAVRNETDLRLAVLDGIEKANLAVIALGVGAATTLAVAEITRNSVRTYHVGDSQIMVIGQKGKVKLMTMSHSPVGYALAAELIDRKGAMMHGQRHIVSNLVGSASMHIELGPLIDLSPKDTVVVASDGLFDNLLEEEIVDACRKGQLLATSTLLRELCHERMRAPKDGQPSKPDDLTFIAFRRRIALA